MLHYEPDRRDVRQPIFNLPTVVMVLTATMVGVHVLRLLLGPEQDLRTLVAFAFIPARYLDSPQIVQLFGAVDGGRFWSPLTYGFLHGGWEHLIVNSLWLVVFGSPVAWRFGATRFLIFFALTTMAGAGAHQLAHAREFMPMVGASAGVSGLTAAAIRFVFEAGGPLGAFRASGPYAFLQPATPFLDSLRNPRVLAFVGLWFVVTLFFGLASMSTGAGGNAVIAWEAHVGGFVAGLLLFPLFDPVPRRR